MLSLPPNTSITTAASPNSSLQTSKPPTLNQIHHHFQSVSTRSNKRNSFFIHNCIANHNPMATAIKVAALSGSLRKASYNTGLIRSAIELSKSGAVEGIQIDHVDISPLPLLNTDLIREGAYPAEVEAFRQKIIGADSILFASPENNYSVAAPLKNAIDWASIQPNVWAGKPAAIVSAGGGFGGGRSQYHLRQIGVFLDLHFINKPEFFLNAFQPPAKFNSDGDLIDEEARKRLKEVLLSLRTFTMQLQGKN
ncbi:NADPH:quinone oxidoreductase-like [Lotus japonicus]|nr:NADPH:quinone oxidoreductase-like [Lotus japonicus]